ncbi:60S ribosomal protein L7a [Vulpes lagopus]
MSPLRGSLSFELSTVTTLVENKKAQLVVIAQDVDPTEWAVLCRTMGFPTALSRGSQAGVSGPQEDLPMVAFTQVNSEDKGGLAKLVEALRTNDNDRYKEICHHWGGHVPGPKWVARIATMEKAKAKKLATQLG